MVPPGGLLLDSRRFQFRPSSGANGTIGRQRLWLVDGHHRTALALADGTRLVPMLLVQHQSATS